MAVSSNYFAASLDGASASGYATQAAHRRAEIASTVAET